MVNQQLTYSSGLRVVHLANIFTGYLIPVSPFKCSGSFPFVVKTFGRIINISFILLFITIWVAYVEVQNKSLLINIQLSIHVTIYLGSMFKVFYLHWHREEIVSIFRQTRCLFCDQKFQIYQKIIFKKVYHRSLFYLIVPLIIFTIINGFSMHYYISLLFKDDNKNLNSTDRLFEQSKVFTKLSPIYFTFNTLSSTLFVCKGIALDSLILILFCIIAEALCILRSTIHGALLEGTKSISGRIDLATWLHQQQLIARLFKKLNTLTSPCIFVIITLNSCTICLVAFSTTKVITNPSLVMYFTGICSVILLQTFLYCEAGQFLRREGQGISEAVYRCHWLRAQPSLLPGLQLVALDSKYSFVVRGGAFFNLSLEFFMSVVGAVLTYFIVLMQFK